MQQTDAMLYKKDFVFYIIIKHDLTSKSNKYAKLRTNKINQHHTLAPIQVKYTKRLEVYRICQHPGTGAILIPAKTTPSQQQAFPLRKTISIVRNSTLQSKAIITQCPQMFFLDAIHLPPSISSSSTSISSTHATQFILA